MKRIDTIVRMTPDLSINREKLLRAAHNTELRAQIICV